MTMNCVPVGGEDDGDEACANCGKHGKLKSCTACSLVKYCGADCQRAHRKQHKKACKARAAELEDERLYSQGHERHEGDFCPICTLPIPLPTHEHSGFMGCCMTTICEGCYFAATKRGIFDCPFCRTPRPDKDDAKALALILARVEKRDPEAIHNLGQKYLHGGLGLQKDARRSVELWTEAVELGSVEALYSLGDAHYSGIGVQADKAKGIQFWTKAAMQGHVESRHNLGNHEGRKGNYDRALRHLLISAKMGLKESVKYIKDIFVRGFATKEQYEQALSGYQAALEEMKSHDRDEAKRQV